MPLKNILLALACCGAITTSFSQSGTLDPSFNGTGVVSNSNPVNIYSENGKKILQQSNGKLIVAYQVSGFAGITPPTAVLRLNTDGSLDQSFGQNGYSKLLKIYVTTAALQADGKIVLAGYPANGNTFIPAPKDFAIVRLTAEGAIDSSFSEDGIATKDFMTEDIPNGVAVQADGKIVVAGCSAPLNQPEQVKPSVMRFNANGTEDNSFINGIRNILLPGNPYPQATTGTFNALALQTDGKVVLGGTARTTGSNIYALLTRLKTDGSYDTDFSDDGLVFSDFVAGGSDAVSALAVQPDGKIVTASTDGDFLIARFNTNGSQDNGFAGTGIAKTDFNGKYDNVTDVIVKPNGSIVVTGYNGDILVAQYGSSGGPDVSFGALGKLTSEFITSDNNETANSILAQPDGKLVLLGTVYNGTTYDLGLLRFNTAGTPDNTFSQDGKLVYYYHSDNTLTNVVAVQPDGKVLVAGTFNSFTSGNITETSLISNDFQISRYNGNGTLDNTFGTAGSMVSDFGTRDDRAYAIAVQANGKIIVAGGNGRFLVARYNADGSPDMSFAGTGYLTTSFGAVNEYADGIAVQADGKIVVSGKGFTGNNTYFFLSRYNSNGSLDNTLNNGGRLVTNFGSALAVQPDGKFILAGRLGLERYNTNGTPDPAFDGDGRVTIDALIGLPNITAIALQADGKIVAAGSYAGGFTVARFNSNGSIDASFENGGRNTITFGTQSEVLAIGVQTDGKIIAAGKTTVNGMAQTALARYLPDGSPDNSFGSLGKTVTNFTGDEYAHSLAITAARVYLATANTRGEKGILAAYKLLTDILPATGNVQYKYYEGNFNVLPDFNALTPAKTGKSANFDLGVRAPDREDYFAFLWEGYMLLPSSGSYTFEIRSDDGCKFFFNTPYSFAGRATIDNDGFNEGRARYATVYVPVAGVYPISLAYFEKTGAEKIEVIYYGPGVPRQVVPNSALVAANQPSAGLNYKVYQGDFNALPDFNALTPVKTGSALDVNVNVRTVNDRYAVIWQGYIDIPSAGNYQFETSSDDGSRLYFNTPYSFGAAATVNNDGLHGIVSATGNVYIAAAGKYPITITYFDKTGDNDVITLYWQRNNTARQEIPASAFSRDNLVQTQVNAASPLLTLNGDATTVAGVAKLYPNPATDQVVIGFMNVADKENTEVMIYDLHGKLLSTKSFGKLPAGQNIIRINIGGSKYPAGVYFVRLKTSGQTGDFFRLVKTR